MNEIPALWNIFISEPNANENRSCMNVIALPIQRHEFVIVNIYFNFLIYSPFEEIVACKAHLGSRNRQMVNLRIRIRIFYIFSEESTSTHTHTHHTSISYWVVGSKIASGWSFRHDVKELPGREIIGSGLQWKLRKFLEKSHKYL